VSQLCIDLIKDLGAFGCSERFQVIGDRVGVSDLVHAHTISGVATLLVWPNDSVSFRSRWPKDRSETFQQRPRNQLVERISVPDCGHCITLGNRLLPRRFISDVPVYQLEISLARDKPVFQMDERIGNIWMAEWKP